MLPSPFSNSRYHLLQVLGQGGMGVVHRALDRLTGETVALKCVTAAHKVRAFAIPTAEQTPDALQLALAREFQTLAGLRHPHIISVLDYGFDAEQQPFYTMNYLPEAQTLLEAGHRRSQPEKLNLIAQVLHALIYLHRRGVLHRDLKPENILVSAGVVQVLDFGLAASGGEAGAGSGSEGGTARYAAPEVWDGQPYTVRADLFALGIILAQLLTGHHPFGPLDQMFIERVLDEPPDLTGTEPALAKLLHRLLAKTPAERLASAEETLAALMDATGQPLPPETTAIRESFLQTAAFVGREAEMLALTTALREAAAGHGSGWLIGGESGVGKTRLISELRTQALVSGFQVLRGQMVEDGGLPYHAWREPVRHLVATLPEIDDLTASVLLPLMPDIAQLLGRPVEPAPELKEDLAQARLFTTMARLFWRAERPVLLILEDLHTAHASLLPLPYLTRLVADYPVLILGSYRSDERLSLPQELPDMTHLMLPRLSSADMADLSAAMLGEAGRAEAIQALLRRETEGNAFFAVEVVRALAEEAGRLGDIGNMKLPETLLPNGIQDIVNRRLERLSPAERDLLAMAAVAGRELELPLIKHLAGAMEVENIWLPRCAEVAVLEIQQGQWQFQHAKLREGLLAQQPAAHLPARHQRVAEAIEQLHPNEADQAARLVHHWHEAGQTEKELTYALKAGQQAAAQYAHRDAIRYFTRALELCADDDLERRFAIYTACAGAYAFIGEVDKEYEALQQLTKLANELGDSKKQADTLRKIGAFHLKRGELDAALAAYAPALQMARAYQLVEVEMTILFNWAEGLGVRRELAEAHKRIEQAELLLPQLNDPIAEIRVRNNLALLENYAGDVRQAVAHHLENLRLARTHGNLQYTFSSLNNLALSYNALGEFEQAEAYSQEALVTTRQLGNVWNESIVLNNLGLHYANMGLYTQAMPALADSLALSRQVGNWMIYSYTLNNLGVTYHKHGDLEQGKLYLQQAIEQKRVLKNAWSEAYTWNMLGHLLLDSQEPNEALGAYQAAESLQANLSQTPTLVETWAGLAATLARLNQLGQAQVYVDKAWHHLQAKAFEGEWEWAISALHLHEAFEQLKDRRTTATIELAHAELQKRAAHIATEAIRQKFLTLVPENRKLERLFTTL